MCICVYACSSSTVSVCVCVCVCVRVLQSTASAKEKKSRKAAFVTFIDYDSVDLIPLEKLLPLDQVRVIKLHGYSCSRCFEITTK